MTHFPDHLNRDEATIINRLLRDALDAGHTISVHDGEAWAVRNAAKLEDIQPHIGATDETTVYVYGKDGTRAGFVFIHGNEPHEVLSDMTDSAFAHGLWSGADSIALRMEGGQPYIRLEGRIGGFQ